MISLQTIAAQLVQAMPEAFALKQKAEYNGRVSTEFTVDYGPGPEVVAWLRTDDADLYGGAEGAESIAYLCQDMGWSTTHLYSFFSRHTAQIANGNADLIAEAEGECMAEAAIHAFHAAMQHVGKISKNLVLEVAK